MLSGEAKEKLQEKITAEGDKRWSEHTRVLPELKLGDFVQFQNLKGRHPLKSDYNGQIVGRHNITSYAVKVNGTGTEQALGKFHPPEQAQAVQGPGSWPVLGRGLMELEVF